MSKYGSRCLFASASLIFLALLVHPMCTTSAQHNEGFFNGSAYVRLQNAISPLGHTGLSFRTCEGGELFSQTSGGNSILLVVRADGLLFSVTVQGHRIDSTLNARLVDNNWYTVVLLYRLGNLTLSVAGHSQVVANSTFNSEILNNPDLWSANPVLIVGKGYHGCLLEGPSIVFNSSLAQGHNVEWGLCPLTTTSCIKTDHCKHEPCMRHGECISLPDRYECRCAARYSGNNCEINNGSPCERNGINPCKNNGHCEEDSVGNYKCVCEGGFTGPHCETEVGPHLCESFPCRNNGSCRVIGNRYECTCMPGFDGPDCEVEINECFSKPCQHGGNCVDRINNYTCDCDRTGYMGPNCELNINECENNPCLNGGRCFDTYGGYICECILGFDGLNCELKLKECTSSPCINGHCTDVVGSYECTCFDGFTGTNCETNINECEGIICSPNSECVDRDAGYQCVCQAGYTGIPPNCTELNLCHSMPCNNGGTCIYMGDRYNCSCLPGFTGVHCERSASLDWCIATPCRNGGTCMGESCECPPNFTGRLCEVNIQCSANPCQHSSKCQDYNGGYYCECEPGWTGQNCEFDINECQSSPCRNAGTCVDTINGYHCECAPGFTGNTCSINIDECASAPCQNGGMCIDHVHGYKCNCTEDYMGDNCEHEYDVCGLFPCKNNGTCVSSNKREYQCRCLPGFEGPNCETNIDDCQQITCPENKICYDGVNGYECRCQHGYTGEHCNMTIDYCQMSPCENNGTCKNSFGNYTCSCRSGFTGRNCEHDIDECGTSSALCNKGICINTPGNYQCFCSPGFTGDHCNLDIDECLSRPCHNNATCEDKINSYNCLCTPGFAGQDCETDINECASVPCQHGGTCHDSIATFECKCPLGWTGAFCEIDIDDCESSPCQNNGLCEDGENKYTCNCTDTGYEGVHCENNIDDCLSAPCMNGAICHDLVKDYNCSCHKGYSGKNCEVDISECESLPCRYGGVCLERSNQSLYLPIGNQPPKFTNFSYINASGYICECVPGTTGENCETNINECESAPCVQGTCKDLIGRYECECEEGFEGEQCNIDINECERYTPCVHGTCSDLKASYECSCDANYGGKNCSVELQGCASMPCLNNGSCQPYLVNETDHKFNCSCPYGFHGDTCEQKTTMSLNGSSYIMVNTTREEGYDIQFRFKTTLPNGLLAIGKGATYYILELVHGKLNLHSSLLNKWEGVFIGSKLSDSNWQKVFVAINNTHLVLAANEEQTIYPINLNEATNASYTSFPTTFVGGTIPSLGGLTHGPSSFVGCTEDVVINEEWVLPEKNMTGMQTPMPITMMGVGIGCPREDQCKPNPCVNGGTCTDLWSNFSCTCERPYLGHICEHNLTAATFGYENITNSYVTVRLNDTSRRAIRHIVDISMFIRTRRDVGTIFYLGSSSTVSNDEAFIMAELDGGELLVKIQFNGTLEKYPVSGKKLDDGNYHLIQVVRNMTLFWVKIDGAEYFRKTISATGILNVHILYLGGMPQMGRTIRQAEMILSLPDAMKNNSVNFKGIIQDVQVSNGTHIMVVEFFPQEKDNNLEIPPAFGDVEFDKELVLKGVVSDDSCRNDPCEHGGTCIITWNDYSCSCPRGYKGKTCQEMEFCQLQNCPVGSTCKNLDNGYECIANATFDGRNMSLTYVLNMARSFKPEDLDSINITYRSQTGGTILYVLSDTTTDYFSVSVYNDQITVTWKFESMPYSQVFRFKKENPDGNWTAVVIKMDSTGIMGKFSPDSDDSAQSFSADNFSLDQWRKLVMHGKVILGGRNSVNDIGFGDIGGVSNKHSYVTVDGAGSDLTGRGISENAVDYPSSGTATTIGPSISHEGAFFKGCLGEVRIGDLLLPFFTLEQLYSDNSTVQNSFQLLSRMDRAYDIDGGCRLCFENQCLNKGYCAAPAESYVCNCTAGYEGNNCGINIDECKPNQCQNNATCKDGIANYTCDCQQGWEGWLCDIDIDECVSNPCQHGGTCINGLGKFECNCTDKYTGPYCENFKLITCEDYPCINGSTCTNEKNTKSGDNFTCICMEGFVGRLCSQAYCIDEPCKNNAVCELTDSVPACKCLPGYTGKFCEEDINECVVGPEKMSPCLNGGSCIDGINTYKCNCSSTGYDGPQCSMDIDECIINPQLCGAGRCRNIPGSFTCECPEGKCGLQCTDNDTCYDKPCKNGGRCIPKCEVSPGEYNCECPASFKGKNCTEMYVEEASSSNAVDIAIIVAPIVGLILLIAAVGLSVFITMARKKRATRGTYSPSQQEYCNPRVEMDNVMKPPPEERLI